MNKRKLILTFIILLFLSTRLFYISDNPPSVYWDEASIGYNAFSVLETGKDEWGEFLPLHFRAFGEFKLPVYIYMVVPFIKLLGLNALAVRLPAVIFSLATLLFTYLLAKKLKMSEVASLFSVFFITTTPWLFIFSRTGYEATAGLMFFIVAIYFYLKSLDDNKWWLMASSIAFIFSIYSYNSFRFLAPLIFVLLLVYFVIRKKRQLKSVVLVVFISAFFLLISFVPIAKLYILDYGGARAQAVSLQGSLNEQVIQFGKNYLSHFSYKFLFSEGDSNLRSQLPGYGQLYLISLPLIVLGLIKIFKTKKVEWIFCVAMLLLAPIPASLTKESPHALRSLTAAPFFALIAGIGFEYLTGLFKLHELWVTGIVLTYLSIFGNYLWNFFTVYPTMSSKEWQYEYKSLFQKYINEDKLLISDYYGQPYIFALFYKALPVITPDFFTITAVYNPVNKWGKSTVSRINDEMEFRIDLIDPKINKGLVFAAPEDNFQSGTKIDEIKFLDGTTGFEVYELK